MGQYPVSVAGNIHDQTSLLGYSPSLGCDYDPARQPDGVMVWRAGMASWYGPLTHNPILGHVSISIEESGRYKGGHSQGAHVDLWNGLYLWVIMIIDKEFSFAGKPMTSIINWMVLFIIYQPYDGLMTVDV